MRSLLLLTVIVLCLSIAGSAQAAPLVQCSMQVNSDTPDMWTPGGTANGDDTYHYVSDEGGMDMPGMTPMWNMTWDMTVKEDPWVNAVLGITNLTAMTQTFTFNVMVPVAPPLAVSYYGGSMQGGITDNTQNGVNATLTTVPGSPLYMGMIDGAGVLPLYPDPPGYAVSAPWDGGSASILAVNAGLPGGTLGPGPAVNGTIAIQHKFTLTPGDSATFSSYFLVVPEPTSAMLLLFGGLFLARRRR